MNRRVLAMLMVSLVVGGGLLKAQEKEAQVSSLKPGELRDFDKNPPKVQALLTYALGLTEQELRYQYGSNDPEKGGMDCSGTVQHILTHKGYRAPRQSNTIYMWVRNQGNLRVVESAKSLSEEQMSYIQPGDLLFWEGTYNVGERFPPTSHVMIYLGNRASDGKPVMVGASSGRYYSGQARHGVSVFDFKLPRAESKAQFVGYGPVPGIKSLNRFLPPLTKPDPVEEIDVSSSDSSTEKEDEPVVKEKRTVLKISTKPASEAPSPSESPASEAAVDFDTSESPTTPAATSSSSSSSTKKKFKPGAALKERPLIKKLLRKLGN